MLERVVDWIAFIGFWPATRFSSRVLVEAYVRRLARLVRALPMNTFKMAFVTRSLMLARHRFGFRFESNVGVRWTAAGFPDLLTRHMMFEGMYQQDVLVALTTLIRRGDTVFDIGGHHGLMALVSGIAAGPSGSVITFEPNPNARRYLEEHVALNGLRNITIEELAVTEQEGTRTFYIQKGDVSWNSTVVEQFTDKRFNESITVCATSVDAYVERTQRVPQLIKIDAEGSEFLVLQGAEQTLRRNAPILIMEFNPASADAARLTIAEYVAFLEGLSYRLTVMKPDVRGFYHFEMQESFEEAKHAVEAHLANVICLPRAGARV